MRRSVTFVDFLFIVLIVLLVTTMIKTPVRQQAVDNKAEYIATLEWPSSSSSDVDFHVLDPKGAKVDFRQKNKGYLALERDDLGSSSDTVTRGGKTFVANVNQEIITLRGWIEGRYVFSAMLWAKREKAVPCKVIIYRLNPIMKVIAERSFTLTANGQEITAARIQLDINGDVRGVDHVFQPIAVKP